MVPIRYVDPRGTEWEVWEVRVARELADAPPSRAAYYGGEVAWLCFASATQRRHLARYPAWWSALGAAQLDVLCQAANPERPSFPQDASVRGSSAR